MVDEFSAFARMPAPQFADARRRPNCCAQAVFAQRVAEPGHRASSWSSRCREVDAASADGRMVGQALTNVLKNAGEAVAARRAADAEPDGPHHRRG